MKEEVPAPAVPFGWQRALALPWLLALLPLLALGLLLWVFLAFGPIGVFKAALPPVEEISIQRLELKPDLVKVHLLNSGPESVTVAQVLVDDAYQNYTLDGGPRIPRFGRAQITIPYPWVEGEPLEVSILTSTGLSFSKSVGVASETPTVSGRYLTAFTLLGTYAGLIPVLAGLLWLPFIRRLQRQWLDFFLALTAGLLLFLGVDAFIEAMTLGTTQVPDAFHGSSLAIIGGLGAFLGLMAVSQQKRFAASNNRLVIAYLIALGIGLHNLGEGLAIGAAYALGNVALGSLLVVGFMTHNTTEGLAIVAPVSKERIRVYHLALMGILAGAPTIAGAWIGGFTFSPLLSTLFFAIGAGAIFQVLYQLGGVLFGRGAGEQRNDTHLIAGFMLGLLIMYLTGLLVVA